MTYFTLQGFQRDSHGVTLLYRYVNRGVGAVDVVLGARPALPSREHAGEAHLPRYHFHRD